MKIYSTNNIPSDYKCWDCGATNCKLWRYSGFPPIELQCANCCIKAQCKPELSSSFYKAASQPGFKLDEDGTWEYIPEHSQRSDQIGFRLPAVPDEEGIGYWGYTSVPQDGVNWWRKLPTYPKS